MMLSFVYAYYENKDSFNYLLTEWECYNKEILKDIEFIITDDCSKKYPLRFNKDLSELGFNFHFFEVLQKANWNWLTCRNIGAYHAIGKWLLVTDIDHFISRKNITELHKRIKFLNTEYVYMLERRSINDERMNPHGNSFLMTKELYWKIGGYDETLAGRYSGTTMNYKKRVLKDTKGFKLLNIPLRWISGEDIKDSQTKGLSRDKNIHDIEFSNRLLRNSNHKIRTLSFPYKEIKCG